MQIMDEGHIEDSSALSRGSRGDAAPHERCGGRLGLNLPARKITPLKKTDFALNFLCVRPLRRQAQI
jgi:hypothetical protein